MQGSAYRVAVDVGGTFTDLVMLEEASGRIRTLKVSSTPREPAQAVLDAVALARTRFGLDFGRVSQFTHATTVCSNTVLEGRGARTGLLVTEGFRDVLEIQRHKRYRLFDQSYRKLAPLVPRHLVHGIPERIDAQGEVVTPLDEAAVLAAVQALARQGIEALAICFLFSFRNARHEQRAGEIARDTLPGCFVTTSSDIFPQYREYERASTTVVNAYLGPRVSTYLQRMSDKLATAGIAVPLHMLQSNGGIIAWTEATRMPCRIVESGPAAGVIAAAHFGKLLGRENLISFDMGGTTAKAGLIENGEVRQCSGQELGTGINISRILQGGGYHVGAPTVDLAEVGAGGGSIAWVDEGNVLKVGPQSAGADPGPVAYGLGGTQVTVTDANLLLGRIPAEDFLGGARRLDVERARRTVEAGIARPLGISIDDACAAVVEVANASMLKMLRIVTVEKGCDPADFAMVAFGGNGALHGPELAHDLGITEVIVPPAAGVLSAQGLLVADIRYDFRQTHVVPVLERELAEVESVYAALETRGRAALRSYGVDPNAVVFQRCADMRYRRQAYEINVRLTDARLAPADAPRIVEAFHEMHERLYGRRDPAGVVQFVTLCVSAIGASRHVEYRALERGDGSARQARKGTRKVFFRDTGILECPLYERARLLADDRLAGPAVIEADDSTVLVLPEWSARCDVLANLILTRERSSQ